LPSLLPLPPLLLAFGFAGLAEAKEEEGIAQSAVGQVEFIALPGR
jgi:hypothetical protein